MFFKNLFLYCLEGFTGALAATMGDVDLQSTGVLQMVSGSIVFGFFILGCFGIVVGTTIWAKELYRWKIKPFFKRRKRK